MYESFFRFTSRPFVAAPLVSSYFASESAEAARQTLTRSIDRAEGPGLIVGPAGVGKSLLCRLLAARFQETFQVAMLSSTRILTRKSLLQNILFELGLPYRGLEEGELRLSLLDHLQPHEECPNGMLLIVDEAHSLPLRLLDEIRMITNLVRDGQPRVRLVMAGSAKLEEKFASPKLESFNQRIAARCYLEPFGRDDTIDYVLSRIAVAGGNTDAIFDDGALRAIYQATDGIPRLINQVADHALVMAFAGGRQQIDAAGIEEAWADLQQLPGPWHDTAVAGRSDVGGATVEFGELDAEPSLLDARAEMPDEVQPVSSSVSESAFCLMPQADGIEAFAEPVPEAEEPPVVFELPAAVADPFGDGFDEEEVVIDQAVIQSAEIFANRTHVVSREGRELAASLIPALEDVAAPATESEPDSCNEPSEIVEAVDERHTEAKEPEPAPIATPVAIVSEEPPAQNDWLSQVAYGTQMFEYTAFEPNDAADLALEALCDVNVALGDLEGEYDAPEEPTVKLSEHRAETLRREETHREQVSSENEDDRAIILVENDKPPLLVPTPEGSVHRVEYQALFAQLRQV